MKLSERIKGTKAQGGAIPFFIGAMLAVIIALAVAWPVMDSAIYGGGGATSTLTFSGNASCGELINITTSAGTKVTFEMNVTGAANCAANYGGYDDVVMALNTNDSTRAAANLTTSINANASITDMTATNPSAGVVVLTFDTHGAAGDNAGVVLAEGAAAGAWSGTTLSGGVSDATTMPSAAGTIVDQLPLFLVLVLLMVFVKALI